MRFACLFLSLVSPVIAADLRAGRAAVKITPPAGMPMAGYYYVRLNEGVHDDLHAKALVLEKDGVKAALVALEWRISRAGSWTRRARKSPRPPACPAPT